MAESVRFENIRALAHGDTISGACRFGVLLTGGSDAAVLTITIGSNSIVLKVAAATSVELSSKIYLKPDVSATITLTGTGPTAYAILEV